MRKDTIMYYSNDYSTLVNLVSVVIRLAIWGIVGYVTGKKAKDVGLSFGLYFTLTFLLGAIGLVISLIKINNQRKVMSMMNQPNAYNPYNQNPYQNQANPYNQQNPYQNQANPYANQQQNAYQNQVNPYANQQQTAYQNQANPYAAQQQNPYQNQANSYNNPYNNPTTSQNYDQPTSTFGISFTCKECGNVQNTAGFCKVCGAKL